MTISKRLPFASIFLSAQNQTKQEKVEKENQSVFIREIPKTNISIIFRLSKNPSSSGSPGWFFVHLLFPFDSLLLILIAV